MLRNPFGFPSVNGEFANRAVAICFICQIQLDYIRLEIFQRTQGGPKFLTGCRARPARNFLIMSASELKSRLTYRCECQSVSLSHMTLFMLTTFGGMSFDHLTRVYASDPWKKLQQQSYLYGACPEHHIKPKWANFWHVVSHDFISPLSQILCQYVSKHSHQSLRKSMELALIKD